MQGEAGVEDEVAVGDVLCCMRGCGGGYRSHIGVLRGAIRLLREAVDAWEQSERSSRLTSTGKAARLPRSGRSAGVEVMETASRHSQSRLSRDHHTVWFVMLLTGFFCFSPLHSHLTSLPLSSNNVLKPCIVLTRASQNPIRFSHSCDVAHVCALCFQPPRERRLVAGLDPPRTFSANPSTACLVSTPPPCPRLQTLVVY